MYVAVPGKWGTEMTRNQVFTDGALTRQLSPVSFESSDPATTLAWLVAIGGHQMPRRSPRELGRVRTEVGGSIVVYRDGLIVATAPAIAAEVLQ